MKVAVTQENLQKALSIVSRVASGRGALPILANVLLKTEQNRLVVAATNLEIAITNRIGSKINEEGAITVPARLMHEFIGSLPKGNIILKSEENKLLVSSGNYSSTINGVSPEEFPAIPKVSKKNKLELNREDFTRALDQTVFAASSDDARPILTGVYFHGDTNTTTIVATDSYRLAERQIKEKSAGLDIIVPASATNDLLRILQNSSEDIVFYFDSAQAMFEVGDTELVTRLVEGNYPDYKQLIPQKNDISCEIDTEEFVNITKVASLFAKESAGSITLEISEADQEVSIASVASQVGENISKAKAKVRGSGSVTLNSRFLLDGLNAVEADKINFGFNDKLSPCVIRPIDNDKNYQHVVMPLKA